MKEYTIDDFTMKSVMDSAYGDWEPDSLDLTKGRYGVNYSSILSELIKVAGRVCKRYASDLFIDWRIIDRLLEEREYAGGKFLFGFREDGIDHKEFVLSRLNNYGFTEFWKEIKALYMLDISVPQDRSGICMKLGKAALNGRKEDCRDCL